MEAESSDSYLSLLPLLGDDDSGVVPLLEQNVAEPLDLAPSSGWQNFQDQAGQQRKKSQPAGIDGPLAYRQHVIYQVVGNTQRGDASTKVPQSAGWTVQRRAGRFDIVGEEPPPRGNMSPSLSLGDVLVSEDKISIRVEVQSILCDLTIGTELCDYIRIAATLRPLAYKLGTGVLVTGGGGPGYDNPSTMEILDAFNIHDDTNILTMENSGNRGVVISTPSMNSSKWKVIIPEMAQILTSSFRMAFNSSTGLSIHIGIGRNYTLQDIKRVSKAIILFEEQMNTYHPKSRSPTSPTLSLNYSQIIPCRSSPHLYRLTDAEVMRKIDAAKCIPELIWLMNRDYLVYGGEFHRCYRYNLRDVIRFNTIEFRQAIGTFQPYSTLDWVKRVTIFTRAAVTTPDSEFDGWAEQGVQDLGVYYRFGVPPPALKGRPLWVRIPIKRTRVLMSAKQTILGRKKKKDTWLFEKIREGNIDRELFWSVYRWRKIGGGLEQSSLSRRAGFFSSTIFVGLAPEKGLSDGGDGSGDRGGESWLL